MTITPESLAKAGSEHAQQCALFCWAALPEQQTRYPQLKWMFAIPNGGSRGDNPLRARKIGGELKAEGVKAGVLDIFLPVAMEREQYSDQWMHGLFIEMKVKSNKPSKEQTEFANAMKYAGYEIALCYSWLEAVAAIERYLGGV